MPARMASIFTTHIWVGNVPGLPIWSMISGLLVKAGNIGKVPSAEPLFAGWFAEAIAAVAPEISDCVAVVWWKGGNTRLESIYRRIWKQCLHTGAMMPQIHA